MAAPSAQTPQRLVDETGHQPGTLERVLRLPDLLQEIARDRVLADRLVLSPGRRRDTHGEMELGLRGSPPHATPFQLGSLLTVLRYVL